MLNAEILYESQNTISELVQEEHFSVEHNNLKSQTPLLKSCKVLTLASCRPWSQEITYSGNTGRKALISFNLRSYVEKHCNGP